METQTQTHKLHCSITAGVNTCGICYNEANFSTSIPQKKHATLPNMELFCCGHGMCENCYDSMMEKTKKFNCPFCRKQGLTIANFDYAISLSLQARGCLALNERLPSPIKITNTLTEYLEEWDDKTYLLYSSNNLYILLVKQIILDKKNKIKKLAEYKRMNDLIIKKDKIKKQRADSREKAVCKICGKNTFTSMKQLEIHINAKHK
tara:strand:+ start:155 stop:772 length:618 start_codon:yes stop_codon:yes gene_type:complete